MIVPLVDVQEYALALGEDIDAANLADDLIAGELAVASYVGGKAGVAESSLRRRQLTLRIMLRHDSRILELPDGPITTLTSVKYDGSLINLTDFRISIGGYWHLISEAWFPGGVEITIDMYAGWLSTTLPATLRRAIIEAASGRRGGLGTPGVAAESIGDYSVTYSAAQLATPQLSVVSQELARPYKRATY